MEWDQKRWPNFSPREVSCSHCQKMGCTPEALDSLQALRSLTGRPIKINSAYRCPEHNKAVGGAAQSRHLFGDAFDVSLDKHDKWGLLAAAKEAGFTGFGFYNTFLHMDKWNPRTWGKW